MVEYAKMFGHLSITLFPNTSGEIKFPACTKGGVVIRQIPFNARIIFELYKGTTKIAEHRNQIMRIIEQGNDYSLKVRSEHPEKLDITFGIEYMSAFAILEKRIPFKFFNNAFDQFWNLNPPLKVIGDKSDDSFYLEYEKGFAEGMGLEQRKKITSVTKINKFSCSLTAKLKEIRRENENNNMPYISLTINLSLDFVKIIRIKGKISPELKLILDPFSSSGLKIIPEINDIIVKFAIIKIYDVKEKILKQITDKIQENKKLVDVFFRWLFGGDKSTTPNAKHPVDVREFYAKDQHIIIKYVSEYPDYRIFLPQVDLPDLSTQIGFSSIGLSSASATTQTASANPRLFSATSNERMKKIKHIVVLMMENRSFDHMLGYLSHPSEHALERRPDVDGLTGNEYNRWRGKTFKVNPLTSTKITQSPAHNTEAVLYHQMSTVEGVQMGGFAANFGNRFGETYGEDIVHLVMGFYKKSKVPIYNYLARQFTICDKWFCSHPGGTLPNRFVTLTGDLTNKPNGEPQIDNITDNFFEEFYPERAKTIFDYLNEKKVKWQYFEHGYSTLRLFKNYTHDIEKVLNISHFFKHCEIGTLPAVSFIDPDFVEFPPGADDHAPADISDGQAFIRKVIKALQKNEQQWKDTLLIINYDEHGGFYDHVVPPELAPLKSTIKQLGPRVPAFIVSPWVKKGGVSHTIFDHTAITSAILRRFYGSIPDAMSQRVKEAHNIFDLLTDQIRTDIITLEKWEEGFTQAEKKSLNKVSNLRRGQNAKITIPKLEEKDFHDVLTLTRLFLGWP